jgi:hypothetical protein
VPAQRWTRRNGLPQTHTSSCRSSPLLVMSLSYSSGVSDTPLRAWHGGAPGLRAGGLLLPPTATGLVYTRLSMSLQEGQTEIGQRPDRVYVTTDRELAWAYASAWTLDGRVAGGGSLYLVEVFDPEPDADLLSLPGVSYQAASASILEVAERGISLDVTRCARAFQRVLEAHARAKNDS